jgi:hypothetical protein
VRPNAKRERRHSFGRELRVQAASRKWANWGKWGTHVASVRRLSRTLAEQPLRVRIQALISRNAPTSRCLSATQPTKRLDLIWLVPPTKMPDPQTHTNKQLCSCRMFVNGSREEKTGSNYVSVSQRCALVILTSAGPPHSQCKASSVRSGFFGPAALAKRREQADLRPEENGIDLVAITEKPHQL